MKISAHHAIAISTALLFPALSLYAQDAMNETHPVSSGPDLYLKAEAGATYVHDLQVNVASREKFKFDLGTRFDAVVGYNLSPCMSTELSGGLIWNSIKSYGANESFSGQQADLYQFPVMLNYLYRLPIKGHFEGFLGAGLGAVVGVLEVKEHGRHFGDLDTTFGGQAMAGLSYHASNHIDYYLSYKFLITTDHKWTDSNWYTKTDGAMTHALELGVSVKY